MTGVIELDFTLGDGGVPSFCATVLLLCLKTTGDIYRLLAPFHRRRQPDPDGCGIRSRSSAFDRYGLIARSSRALCKRAALATRRSAEEKPTRHGSFLHFPAV